jgi:hypothetical protein
MHWSASGCVITGRSPASLASWIRPRKAAKIQWHRGDQATAYAGLATEAVAIGLDRVSLPPARGTISNAQTLHLAAGLSFAGLPAALAVLRHDPSRQPGGMMLVSLVVGAVAAARTGP